MFEDTGTPFTLDSGGGVDAFADGGNSSFSFSGKDSFAKSGSETVTRCGGDAFAAGGINTVIRSNYNEGGFLSKFFDAFSSSSNVDDTFATGALDDAFATDVKTKEQSKYNAFYGSHSVMDIKNVFGNNPTTIVTGVGFGKFGNKLKK